VALEHHPGAHSAQDPGLLNYPGDDAVPQALAAWMGAHARQAGLPPELPVMAALTESGLHNLNYGDRDSVGFFQMRLGIWNTGAYSGYPHHPELQLQWFIEHALAARQADPALAQSPGTWGEWVANVEQPAAEYRGRYQLQLGAAQELLHGSGQGSVPLSTAPTPVPAPLQHLPIGRAAIKVALEYLTTPHQGGSGLDGSTLVQYAYGREGLHLPGVASELLDVGTPIARHALRPGDAVFFAQPDGRHRVGLYIGDGRYVSIPREGGHAKVRALAEHSADGDYAAARRYTPESVSDPSRFARSLPTIKS
jgi:cell wall-associated NlpC family hydrolase